MKTKFFLPLVLILVAALSFMSCRPHHNTGNFKLQLKAKYGNQTFAISTPNTDPAARRIQIDVLKFYLSHIQLVKTDNSLVEIKNVVLADLSNPNTLTINVGNVGGDFKAINFGTGVDSIQNNTDPNSSTLSTDDPLNGTQGMYWPWLKYRFEVLEARCDTTTTGSGPFNWFPVYHIGLNAQYRSIQLLKNFSVCCENPYTLILTLDVKKIFYGDSLTLDIISESGTQMSSSDNPAVAPKFVDNFSKAFEVN